MSELKVGHAAAFPSMVTTRAAKLLTLILNKIKKDLHHTQHVLTHWTMYFFAELSELKQLRNYQAYLSSWNELINPRPVVLLPDPALRRGGRFGPPAISETTGPIFKT